MKRRVYRAEADFEEVGTFMARTLHEARRRGRALIVDAGWRTGRLYERAADRWRFAAHLNTDEQGE